jgi:hypothetical protein
MKPRSIFDRALDEVDERRAEMYLRTLAASVGVQDIDYVIVLFSREVEKRDAAGRLESFDERKWFAKLRDTHPWLWPPPKKKRKARKGKAKRIRARSK